MYSHALRQTAAALPFSSAKSLSAFAQKTLPGKTYQHFGLRIRERRPMQKIPLKTAIGETMRETSGTACAGRRFFRVFQLKLYRFFQNRSILLKKSSAFLKKIGFICRFFSRTALSTKIEGATKLVNKLSTPVNPCRLFQKSTRSSADALPERRPGAPRKTRKSPPIIQTSGNGKNGFSVRSRCIFASYNLHPFFDLASPFFPFFPAFFVSS